MNTVEYNGSTVRAMSLVWDAKGRLVFGDMVAPDIVLHAIVGAAALGAGYTRIHVGDTVVHLNDPHDGRELKFHHHVARLSPVMGSLSRLVIYRREVETANVTENGVEMFVVAENEGDARNQAIAAIEQNAPVALVAPDGQSLAERCFRLMLDEGDVETLKGFGRCGFHIVMNRHDFAENRLARLVSMPVEIDSISMTDFVERCGPAIVERIKSQLAPVFDPKHDEVPESWKRTLGSLKRTVLERQKDVIFALAAAASKGIDGAFGVGEMSTGKTTIAIAASLVINPRGIHLVMCPPQLTHKWKREIQEKVAGPHVKVVVCEDWMAAGRLIGLARDIRAGKVKGPLFIVLSRTRSRMYERWRPAVMWRLSGTLALDGVKMPYFRWEKVACCPNCGAPVIGEERDEDGETFRFLFTRYTLPKERRVCEECGSVLWQVIHERPKHADLREQRRHMMEQWLTQLPGITKMRAKGLIETIGVDALARDIASGNPGRLVDHVYAPNQRKRRERLLKAIREIGFTLTPCDYMPYKIIQRFYRGILDVFSADECHELKGEGTAQGLAFGGLASVARFTIPLTGTLIGGYAEDAHPLLARIAPRQMAKAGYPHGTAAEYQMAEGVVEEIIIEDDDDGDELKTAKGKNVQTIRRRKPGYSPVAIARDLLPVSAFIRLDDIQAEIQELEDSVGGNIRLLPSYREVSIMVEMAPEQRKAYDAFQGSFKENVFYMPPSARSQALHAMLYWPDLPERNVSITWESEGNKYGFSMGAVRAEGDLTPTPKEVEVLKLVRKELGEGRRVMLFATYTNKHDVTPRIQALLQKEGVNVRVLRPGSVPAAAREEWLERQVEKGVQVVITNPAVVMTGLDLVWFPTLAFVQTGYSTYVLRQASRRAWRISQDQPCRTYFFTYRDTAQEVALSLMAAKQRVALNAEGDLSESALDSCANMDDGLAAIGRALVQGERHTLTGTLSSIDEDSNAGEYLANIDHVPTPEEIEWVRAGNPLSTFSASRTARNDVVEQAVTEDLFSAVQAVASEKRDTAKPKSRPKPETGKRVHATVAGGSVQMDLLDLFG